MFFRNSMNPKIPFHHLVAALSAFLATFAVSAPNERSVVFRVLCFEHRDGITSAKIDAKPGSRDAHEIVLLTGNFTNDYRAVFADNVARFYVDAPERPAGRRLVAEGPLAAGERQLFLLFPNSDGAAYPYLIRALDDDEKSFPMGATRVLNLCPVPVRFHLAGMVMNPVAPGAIVVYPMVRKFDEWNMYQVNIDFSDSKGNWVPVSSPSWKASELKRDLVITMMDRDSRQPRIAYYKDLPPWRKPKHDLTQ